MERSICKNQRPAWLKFALTSLSLLPVLSAGPVLGAERLSISYGLLKRSIPLSSIETFVDTGQVDDNLARYARNADLNQIQRFRQALQTPAPVGSVEVSQFLYTSIGEELLERLSVLIQTEDPQSGFYAIRAALILAADEPEGLTLLNVLRQFPLEEIEIDLNRSLEIAAALETFINQTNEVIAQINQQSTLEATAEPLISALPSDPQQPGRFTWQKRTITLTDQSRDRTFPADIYLPLTSTSRPIVVISHGLGSDRFSFAYLAQHLASYGFVVAVPEHPGSSAEQLQALLAGRSDEVVQPREFIDRPLDVSYLLDELSRLAQTHPDFRGRLDLNQVGVVGQSFGGYTALALAGATIRSEQLETDCQTLQESLNVSLLLQCRALDLPKADYDLTDPRVKAAIAINPINSTILGPDSLGQIKIPVMLVSSSADTVAPALPEQIQPFNWLTTPNKYLAVIEGGTHFSTIAESPNAVVAVPSQVIGPNPEIARGYVSALSTAFFQTYTANQSNFRFYLSAAYANAISQEPLALRLVQSFGS